MAISGAQHGNRKVDGLGVLKNSGDSFVALTEICVAIGVERNPHSQAS